MAFLQPNKNRQINIVINGVEKKVALKPEEYYLLDDSDNIVIKNAILDKIARENGASIKRIELEHTTITKDLLYIVYRAFFDINGVEQSIIGEASKSNLDSEIAEKYPFTMAEVRATSRAFIKLLGLKEQGVYADCEFGGGGINKEAPAKEAPAKAVKPENKKSNEAPAPEKSIPSSDKSLSKEEAGEVICNVGFYAEKPKPIKDISERAINWILNQESEDENMKKIQAAIRIYKEA